MQDRHDCHHSRLQDANNTMPDLAHDDSRVLDQALDSRHVQHPTIAKPQCSCLPVTLLWPDIHTPSPVERARIEQAQATIRQRVQLFFCLDAFFQQPPIWVTRRLSLAAMGKSVYSQAQSMRIYMAVRCRRILDLRGS